MARRLPNLNSLRAFEAAARRLSFTLAADELSVTQGAVSRQIRALELYLGAPLFRRLTRAIELTEQGRTYVAAVRDAFDRLERATLHLRVDAERKLLTVNCLPTFAMHCLIPRLPRFYAANPYIEVRMVMSIEPVNFGHDDVDIAVRVGSLPRAADQNSGARIDIEMVRDWADIQATPLRPDVLVPVCSTSFLEANGPFEGPEDFYDKPLLQMASRAHAWPDWFETFGLSQDRMVAGPAFGHFFMATQAAADGLGIALIPSILLPGRFDLQGLAILDRFAVRSAGAYYALCRKHQADIDHLRLFRDWLVREVRDDLRFPGLDDQQVT